jgi:type II restriction enzyme
MPSLKTNRSKRIKEARSILIKLGMPRQQLNDRSALCLLALVNLAPEKNWSQAESPLIGITPIMDWARKHYGKKYAPNTRETIRRQTMHQFVQAGIALYNPDQPDRAVNSPHAVYRIELNCLALLRAYEAKRFDSHLKDFLKSRPTLARRYAKDREMRMVPVKITPGKQINLTPGKHSELIRDIVEQFAPRFVPGGDLVYVGDTGEKWGYFNESLLTSLGVAVDDHGKMPDVVIYYPDKDWLILAESVTSHGPVDSKRHEELAHLFLNGRPGLVYVSAFPDRRVMNKYLEAISWETEVWVADHPSHLIHFNGSRFLGPYKK